MQHRCSDGISLRGCSPICCCMVGYIRSNVTATVAYKSQCTEGHVRGYAAQRHARMCLRSGWLKLSPEQHHGTVHSARRQMRWLRACRIAASSKMWCIYC